MTPVKVETRIPYTTPGERSTTSLAQGRAPVQGSAEPAAGIGEAQLKSILTDFKDEIKSEVKSHKNNKNNKSD